MHFWGMGGIIQMYTSHKVHHKREIPETANLRDFFCALLGLEIPKKYAIIIRNLKKGDR